MAENLEGEGSLGNVWVMRTCVFSSTSAERVGGDEPGGNLLGDRSVGNRATSVGGVLVGSGWGLRVIGSSWGSLAEGDLTWGE